MPETIISSSEKTQSIQDQIRTRWRLDTLLESSLSLAVANDPIRALDDFLLLAMGWAGTSQGFVLITDPWADDSRVAARGLTESELAELRHGSSTIAREGLEPTMGCPTPGHGSQLLIRNPPPQTSSWPKGMQIGVAFATDGCGPGMIGLGPRMSGEVYSDKDAELLLAMTSHFTSALDRIRAARVIQSLNSDLNERNERLRAALNETSVIRSDLRKQLFHMDAINGAMEDLGLHLRDEHRCVDTFLLTLCGVFGLSRAELLLHDPDTQEPGIWSRGGNPSPISNGTARAMLYAGLESFAFGTVTPLSIHFLDPVSLAKVPDVPESWRTAPQLALFRLDESISGMLALHFEPGQAIPEETFQALAHSFLLFLRNARSFATIGALNRSLTQRNQELEHTLGELTVSRHRVEVLEKAKDQIRSVLKRYALRFGRPSWKDGVWMCFAAVLLGFLFNLTSPSGLSIIPKEWTRPSPAVVTQDQIQTMLSQGAILVDARPPELARRDPVANTINISPALFSFTYDMHLKDKDLDTPIIVFGRTLSSLFDEDVAYRLKAQGHENVYVLPEFPR